MKVMNGPDYMGFLFLFVSQVLILQRLLLPKGVAKNLKFVLSDNIIVQSNLEGIHGKKRLLNYQRFIDAVYRKCLSSIMIEQYHN